MKNILVTGVNGFIGSNITKNLLQLKYHVMGLDISESMVLDLKAYNNFSFFKIDITDKDSYVEELKKADLLIHCAALAHNKSEDLSRNNYFKINYEGTKNLLSFMKKSNLKKIIFLSTVLVYNDVGNQTVPDEDSATKPVGYYAESKLAAEEYIKLFCKRENKSFIILRLTPVYGKTFTLNIDRRVYVPGKLFFYKIGSGDQMLSLCSIKNVTSAIEGLIEKEINNEVFIIKDKNNYSINGLITAFKVIYKENYKPILTIPGFIPYIALRIIALIFPKKGTFYLKRFNRIAVGSIYFGNKIKSHGINIDLDLEKTLKDH